MPDVRFVIPARASCAIARAPSATTVQKHVLLPASTFIGCIKGFDLFAMSSVTEGLGTSLLDAMACARPIVATTAGGIPEIVEDGVTGLLVPPRDHSVMADAIVRMLKDAALRQRMGAAGLARVTDRFTLDRMVEQTAEVYRSVSSERSNRQARG